MGRSKRPDQTILSALEHLEPWPIVLPEVSRAVIVVAQKDGKPHRVILEEEHVVTIIDLVKKFDWKVASLTLDWGDEGKLNLHNEDYANDFIERLIEEGSFFHLRQQPPEAVTVRIGR